MPSKTCSKSFFNQDPRIARALLPWYDRQGRKDLPWHQPRTAYRVWLSEIMLQQTQVTTVIPYFERFIQRFPDLASLASAPLDRVIENWSGLGYYARARNLHKTAQQLMQDYQGIFPQDPQQLVQLPGIGRSTAAAIVAQAFNHRAAILDGNVKRVLARFYGIRGWPGQATTLARLWEKAEAATPDTRLCDYTQAIMDLGALICRARQANCDQCPLQQDCVAYQTQTTSELPEARPRKSLPTRDIQLLLIENTQHEILLQRRPDSGIWGGLWSLPEADYALPVEDLTAHCQQKFGWPVAWIEKRPMLRHSFTHFHLRLHPVHLRRAAQPEAQSRVPVQEGTQDAAAAQPDQRWQAPEDALNSGIATPIRKLLKAHLLQAQRPANPSMETTA